MIPFIVALPFLNTAVVLRQNPGSSGPSFQTTSFSIVSVVRFSEVFEFLLFSPNSEVLCAA